MKKTLICFLLVSLFAFCLSSCGDKSDDADLEQNGDNSQDASGEEESGIPDSGENGEEEDNGNPPNSNENDNTPPEKGLYEKLDELCGKVGDKVDLTVSSTVDDVTLTAKYVINKESVEYTVEKLNLLPTDENFEEIDENFKKTVTGTAKIVDGKVIHVDGEAVTLPESVELRGAFSFDEKYFDNAKNENGEFSAEVVSPSEFFGIDKDISDMSVSVKYTEHKIESLALSYKMGKSIVETTYIFK